MDRFGKFKVASPAAAAGSSHMTALRIVLPYSTARGSARGFGV